MACKLQKLVPVQKLYRVYARLVTREAQGGNHLANFLAPLEKCVGHSFKKFGPLSKNSSSPLASQAGYRPGLCMWKTYMNCFKYINVQWDVLTQITWKKFEFRVRTCACILSCVLVTINTRTLKCWCFSSYSSITHLCCFKNVVSRTRIPIYFSRIAQCCRDVFLLGLCGAEIQRRFLALLLRCAQCSSPDNRKRHVNAQLIVAKFSHNL